MKKMLFLKIWVAGLVFAGQTSWAAQFVIDPVHSDVSFKVKHLVVSKVTGQFEKFSGWFVYDEKNPSLWKASATIETASINTRNEKRDTHLRSDAFLDVEKFPAMTFVSSGVSDFKDNKAKLHGMLTLRGVQKPMALDLEIGGTGKGMQGETRAGFEATTKINRQDFGVSWNKVMDGGGVVVGDDVDISIRIEGMSQEKETPLQEKTEKKPAEKTPEKSAEKKK